MLHKINKIIEIEPFSVVCLFNTNELRIIDLCDWIEEFKAANNGWTSMLADPEYFKTATLQDGTLTWSNQIDFCPDVLYSKSKVAN